MIELDFFSLPQTRSGAERKQLIKQFKATHTEDSDFTRYGYDYYDNSTYGVGYGGYHYDGRYKPCVTKMIDYYQLEKGSRVLELGCAKGFVLIEFLKQGMDVSGIDLSQYAVDHAVEMVKEFVHQGSCTSLEFDDDAFDLVYSKEMLPHLTQNEVAAALREAQRVCKTDNIFLEIQVGNSQEDRDLIYNWDITHQCVESSDWWRNFLKDQEFRGQVHFKAIF